MLDITVKTLDGRNRSFSVPDDITVRQFKEKIASSIEIDADIQRLIFQGRVLDDDKKIDDYNVNGKTIHVVQRSPPSARAASAAGASSSAAEPGPARDERPRMDGNSFVVGSFSIPPDAADVNQVHNMMRQVLSGMGGEFANNVPTSASTSTAEGPSVDVHINVSHGPQMQSESQLRINQAMHMLSLASTTLDRLEHQQDNDSDVTDSTTASATPAAAARPPDSRGAAAGTSSSSRVEHPATSALSPVLEEMMRLHGRLQPHLLRYRQLMSDDQDYTDRRSDMMSAQRLCNLTSEVLHSLSHVYHHVSDLMVDMSRTPPRNLRAPPPMPTTAIIQQTIPVQINVAHVPMSATASTAESSSSSTSTATTASQQQQQQQPPPTSTSASFGFPPMGSVPQFRMGPSSGIPLPYGEMPQGMHVFMDMAPGRSFRIQFGTQASSSGQTVTTSAATAADTSSTAGARATPSAGATPFLPVPPDALQNILRVANGELRAQSAQPGGSRWMPMPSQPASASRDGTQSRNTADLLSSATTSSSSSGGSGTTPSVGPVPAGVGFPGMPPMGVPPMPMPPGATPADLLPVDPCLPCHSRHFLNRRTQMAAGQGAATDQNQEPSLAGMVTNLVSSIVGPLAGMGQVEINHSRVASTSSQSSSSTSSSSTSSSFSSADTTSSAASSSTSSSTASASGAAGSRMADLGLGGVLQVPDLMQALHGQSIAEFLSSIGMEYAPAQGEGLLADLFHIVATHMVFTDLTMVFFGVPTPLERLREPLQQFVHENVLSGNPATEANIDAAVDRLMRDMQSDIDAVGELPTSNNVDFLATLTQFMRVNLRRALCLIANATAESGFAASLYDLSRNMVHEFVVLSRHCLEGGQAALETMLQERLRSFSSDVSPAVQTMMTNMAIQQLRMIVPLIRLSDDDVQQYVVFRSAAADSMSSDNSFASACDAVVDGAEGGIDDDEAVHMDDQTDSDVVNRPSAITASLLSQLPPPPEHDSEADIQVSYGSEDWHSALPTEWIPVITRDIIRQRRQAPQPSLSDAYLSGMPSKRRKVMKRDHQRDEAANANSVVISEALKRATQRAGAQPTTSQSQLAEDVAESPALCAAFQHEMNAAISRRLENETDYMPEKYPNTKRFFKSE